MMVNVENRGRIKEYFVFLVNRTETTQFTRIQGNDEVKVLVIEGML